MDERAALIRAVVAAPDDDLPRLVFADWLDEHNESAYAAFIRAQIELSNTPLWEPFAVHLRHREPDLVSGAPWWYTLPRVDGHYLEWHPNQALRRGFAWGLFVRDVPTFLTNAPRLFDEAPVGHLHLPTATLDQWKQFATQPWLPRVKAITFYGRNTPIEPVRVLCESPLATGLEEITFHRAGSHAMPELMTGLFQSPLGRQLRALEFQVGYESLEELIAAFAAGREPPRLNRLAFVTTRFAPEHLDRLTDSPILDSLTELAIINSDLGADDLRQLTNCRRLAGLTRLTLNGVQADPRGLTAVADSEHLPRLRMLDLGRNWRGGGVRPLIWAGLASRLRSLDLSHTRLDDRSLNVLAGHWNGIVELKLDHNQLTDLGARPLLERPIPPELVALTLRGNRFTDEMKRQLQDHFGERVIL